MNITVRNYQKRLSWDQQPRVPLKRILEEVSDTYKTAQEINENLGMFIRTLRNTLDKLVALGFIKKTSSLQDTRITIYRKTCLQDMYEVPYHRGRYTNEVL